MHAAGQLILKTCERLPCCLQGSDFRRWLEDSGAEEGDDIALSRQGSLVLISRIAAGSALQQPQPQPLPPPPQQQAQQLQEDEEKPQPVGQLVPPAGGHVQRSGGRWRESNGWFRRSLTASACKPYLGKLGLSGGPLQVLGGAVLHALSCACWFRQTAAAPRPASTPPAKLFERLTGRAGGEEEELDMFDPDLRKSVEWGTESAYPGGLLRVSAPC